MHIVVCRFPVHCSTCKYISIGFGNSLSLDRRFAIAWNIYAHFIIAHASHVLGVKIPIESEKRLMVVDIILFQLSSDALSIYLPTIYKMSQPLLTNVIEITGGKFYVAWWFITCTSELHHSDFHWPSAIPIISGAIFSTLTHTPHIICNDNEVQKQSWLQYPCGYISWFQTWNIVYHSHITNTIL